MTDRKDGPERDSASTVEITLMAGSIAVLALLAIIILAAM